MFFIENEGQAVAETDYWQSVQAQAGYVYLSWNAFYQVNIRHKVKSSVVQS